MEDFGHGLKMLAGLIGGIGLAHGVLNWGRPLLEGVAFEIVKLDGRVAIAAQLGQALVILGYVAFGYVTSMNQALVGSMFGVGIARRKSGGTPVLWKAVRGIFVGWGVGPLSGVGFGFAIVVALQWSHLR